MTIDSMIVSEEEIVGSRRMWTCTHWSHETAYRPLSQGCI